MQFDDSHVGVLGGGICFSGQPPPLPFDSFDGNETTNTPCSLCKIKVTSEQKNCPSLNAMAWAQKQYEDSGYVPDANLVSDVQEHLQNFVQKIPESPVEMKNLKRELTRLQRKEIHDHFSLHVQPSAERVYDEQIRIWRTLEREALSQTCTRDSDTGKIIVHSDMVKLLKIICDEIRQLYREQRMFKQKETLT